MICGFFFDPVAHFQDALKAYGKDIGAQVTFDGFYNFSVWGGELRAAIQVIQFDKDADAVVDRLLVGRFSGPFDYATGTIRFWADGESEPRVLHVAWITMIRKPTEGDQSGRIVSIYRPSPLQQLLWRLRERVLWIPLRTLQEKGKRKLRRLWRWITRGRTT